MISILLHVLEFFITKDMIYIVNVLWFLKKILSTEEKLLESPDSSPWFLKTLTIATRLSFFDENNTHISLTGHKLTATEPIPHQTSNEAIMPSLAVSSVYFKYFY